jgi:hypothetical protein
MLAIIVAIIVANKVVIVSALLAISELLALVPGVKANSVFQLVVGALKKVKDVISAALI